MPSPDHSLQARLDAARLLGIGFIAALAQLLVDMPGGYFGLADDTTRFGEIYGALAVTAGLGLAALRRPRPTIVRRATPVVLALHIGAFLPALAHDPLVSGIVILWCLQQVLLQFLVVDIVVRHVDFL